MSNFFEAGKAAMTSNRQDWETPQALFDELNSQYHFTIDVAATDENAKCDRYYTIEDDALAKSWAGETVWCNPPYDRASRKWIAKMAEEAAGGGSHRRPSSSKNRRQGIPRLPVQEGERPHRVHSRTSQVRAWWDTTQQRTVSLDARVLQLLR